MNPFTTIPRVISVLNQISKFSKVTYKQVKAFRDNDDYESERAVICENTGIYTSKIADILKVKFEVERYENVPESGPIVIYSNHQGYADVLILYNTLRKFQFGFVGKEEFESSDPVARAMNSTSSVFLKRGEPRAAINTLKETTELLNKGFSLCIFPEGTRSREVRLLENSWTMHSSSFRRPRFLFCL